MVDMARTARSVAADRIRIEDEVWEEAFASRVRSRPPRTRAVLAAVAAQDPVRLTPRPAALPDPVPLAESPATPRLELAQPGLGQPDAPRRTVRIQGRGAERNLPVASSRQRARRPHESAYFKPDRLAMWAVLLGFMLVAAAMLSAHA
jgi:hypothetical protein